MVGGRGAKGTSRGHRLRISLVMLQEKYLRWLKVGLGFGKHQLYKYFGLVLGSLINMKPLSKRIPVSETSELLRLRRPRRISRAFWLLPVLGVGGREASMKGIESSSKRGDFDLGGEFKKIQR